MTSFISSVERLVELHKNLAAAAAAQKDMKKEKSMLMKEVLEYMISHDIKDHIVDDFEIVNTEREVKNKLSLEFIEGMLEQFNNETLDQEKIDSIVSAIAESESTGEMKNSLSIKKKKQPRAKKSKKTDDSQHE